MKIDRSFVTDLDESVHQQRERRGEKIVRAIASLGEAFGLTTVVEGIETTEQMNIARKAGCTEMQGYLISRPVPASDVANLIQQLIAKNKQWEIRRGG
jgi:EAL domain-containing protein (putative c-di-GMP-specific phosphodiesterase class I)